MNAEHYTAIVRNHPKCTNPEICVICTLIAEIERLRSGMEGLKLLRYSPANFNGKEDHKGSVSFCLCLAEAEKHDARIDALLGGKG